MDYVFKIYLRKPVKCVKIKRKKAKRIIYNPVSFKNVEDYESGFSFPKKLIYSNKINEDDLEF